MCHCKERGGGVIPLNPGPWDLPRAKAPWGRVPPSRVPFCRRGGPLSICPSAGSLRFWRSYSRTISSSLFFSRNCSQALKVAQKLEDSPATLVVT